MEPVGIWVWHNLRQSLTQGLASFGMLGAAFRLPPTPEGLTSPNVLQLESSKPQTLNPKA